MKIIIFYGYLGKISLLLYFHVVPESVKPAQAVSTCVLDPTAVLKPPDTSLNAEVGPFSLSLMI
jgi:hypothetical protein